MKEKDYYTKIRQYFTRPGRISNFSLAIEVKITKGNTLPFRALMPHQEEALMQSRRSFAHKIDDTGRRKKPFDIFVLNEAVALIIVVYYKLGKSTVVCIDLTKFIEEKYASGEKSLTLQRAKEIGTTLDL